MDTLEQLKEFPLFKTVTPDDLEALLKRMKVVRFPANTVLFKKGDPGDAMYLVMSGKLRIYSQDTAGQEFTLTTYGPGRIFGEFAIFDGSPRSTSAAALEPLELLALSRGDFLVFLPEHPKVGLAMINHLTERLRYITTYL
ncbi:MAG TPA: cyclic nucleotide-binding domain-containing protein, partial [Aggregatilineales bacterium]|nr:cyclic nucleotide-binding domain-containing protein [Aggregatilineales bacterium]